MIRDQPRSRAASPQNTSADARPMIVSRHLAPPAEPLAPGRPRPCHAPLSAAVTGHVTAPRRATAGPAAQMVIS